MASFELPDMPDTRVTPQLLLGAVSPLWSYFGVAAASGVAYWWMTRWTQPANLEALFGRMAQGATLAPRLTETAGETAEVALEAAVETVADLTATEASPAADAVQAAGEILPETPVGGEAAPISPLAETLAAPEPEPAPEPVSETPPAVDVAAEPAAEPLAKPRMRKGLPPNGLEA